MREDQPATHTPAASHEAVAAARDGFL